MRILHIGKYYPPVAGGMERFLADLVDAQRAAGHEVEVLVHDDGRHDSAGDPPWLHRCAVWFTLFFAPVSPRFPFLLRRIVRRFRPDLVHLHMPNTSAFWALLVRAARRVPWVVHWHSDVEPSRFRLSLRLGYPHYAIFERAVLEAAEAIVVTSPHYLEASRTLEPWSEKCHVVPLGVAHGRLPEARDVDERRLWPGEGLRVLMAGRLAYYKGFDTVVRAVASHDDMQLTIVGDGEERSKLKRIVADAHAASSVRLLGEVGDEMLTQLMATCEVFCLPSRERTEAFGLVLLEAMRYGKPLVVSALPGSGMTWVARDGQNALHVPPDDPAAWRVALELLERSPRKRALMGRLGLERYQRDFDIRSVAAALDRVYGVAARLASRDAPLEPLDWSAEPEPAEGTEALIGADKRLLVVIPALNEADCIGEVISELRRFPGVHVLVVDDGSTDDTAAVAMLHGATVTGAPLWQGAWGAIQTGIRYAVRHGYAGVVTMDADGQHEPGYMPQLIEAARDADVVIAACPSRGSRMRHVAWAYFRFLTGLSLDDLTSGFRYYGARACALLAQEEATLLDYQDIGVLLLLRRANLRIAEIAVAMNPRKSGASRVFHSWWTVGRYMAETTLLCLARWNQPSRTKRA
ncbi:MAG TPA: glycosyltransferase [Usitatibacter sp.]|jgi:glycosyltransferase involved in cell wall biosynthesis|nr:glycosyltransferase [Usitatibacter sp.]